MSRYFFEIEECGVRTIDNEGRDCADLATARAGALKAAREIMCAEIVEGRLCFSCRVEIFDEGRALVDTVRFRDAVAVTGL